MGITLNLDERILDNIRSAATTKGCSPECLVETMVNEQFQLPCSESQRQLTDDEVSEKLRRGGVRQGNPKRLMELLREWNTRDFDPDSNEEEYAQIQKNIDEGGISMRRFEV